MRFSRNFVRRASNSFRRHRVFFWLRNPHRAFRKFADVDNSDCHDFLLLRVSPPHQPWLAKPTWNGVLSSSWWNRSMCGPLLMLASHYTDTRFVTMARTGGLSWYRLGIWPCTRYGGREARIRISWPSGKMPTPTFLS